MTQLKYWEQACWRMCKEQSSRNSRIPFNFHMGTLRICKTWKVGNFPTRLWFSICLQAHSAILDYPQILLPRYTKNKWLSKTLNFKSIMHTLIIRNITNIFHNKTLETSFARLLNSVDTSPKLEAIFSLENFCHLSL